MTVQLLLEGYSVRLLKDRRTQGRGYRYGNGNGYGDGNGMDVVTWHSEKRLEELTYIVEEGK